MIKYLSRVDKYLRETNKYIKGEQIFIVGEQIPQDKQIYSETYSWNQNLI
jgi:hypothetical protein